MLRSVVSVLVALAIAALAFSGRGSPVPDTARALALAPSLTVDQCKEVKPGEVFEVAISVSGVSNLMAWDIYYAYKAEILEVINRDVRQFLDSEPNSSVFDFSDPLPNTSGLYRIGAADTGGSGSEEDGSGVLAVLTLRALDEGISWSSLASGDTNHDGEPEYGPTLTETGGKHIGDQDGDGIFDGALRGGQIAVGRPCKNPAPTPHVDPDVVPVRATVGTPTVSTPTEPGPPDSGEPGTAAPHETEAPDTGAPARSSTSGQRSPTPEARVGPQSGSGGSPGGGLSPLLASVIGAGGGAAIIVGYVFFRAVRRPA